MSLLDEIRANVLDESISLGPVLRRCKVLAHRIKFQPLAQWVEHELNGYPDWDSIPPYRRVPVQLKASGTNGVWTVTGQTIPTYILPEDLQEIASTGFFTQDVGTLEANQTASELQFRAPDAVWYWLASEGGGNLEITSVYQQIPPGAIAGVLGAIRSRILDFVLAIEDEFPSLQDSQIGSDPQVMSAVAEAYRVQINGNNPILNFGNQVTIANSTSYHIEAGNFRSLDAFLEKQNVSVEHRQQLKSILDDLESGEDPNTAQNRLREWLSDRAGDASEGVGEALKEGTKRATKQLLSDAIKEYAPKIGPLIGAVVAASDGIPFF